MSQHGPQVNIVVPLYNEEQVFDKLKVRLQDLMDASKLSISVILVDDGSRDTTSLLMEKLSKEDKRFVSIFLSRNFGHQYALSAGLSQVDASEAVFIIDGDLQDPPELLETFYPKLQEGYDVVYAVRTKRKESFIKKAMYKLFYRVLNKISKIDIPLDTGDFSLVSRRVVDDLNGMGEESRFIRGMRSWVGYKQIGMEYERDDRKDGDSKYSFKQLFQLAFSGIFNFSEFPIKMITVLGSSTVIVSLLYLALTVVKQLIYGAVPEGFTGIIFTITLFGGVQLLSIGIIGEYILRIFYQVKDRPLFIIKRKIKNGETVL